jgi:hypothetical protein
MMIQDNSGEPVCQSGLVVTKPDVEHYTCPYTDVRQPSRTVPSSSTEIKFSNK